MKAQTNPFRSSRIAELRYYANTTSLQVMANRVIDSAGSYTIVGPPGSGKSTLLEDFEPILRNQAPDFSISWIHLNNESPKEQVTTAIQTIRNLSEEQILLLDGGEVVGKSQWRQIHRTLKKKSFRLITTLHKPNRSTTLKNTNTCWDTALQCIADILKTKPDAPLVAAAHAAFKENDGNLREVFRACYWNYALRSEPIIPTANESKL